MWQKKIKDIGQLQAIALEIRKNILKSLAAAGSGHTGGSLGLADIFTVLYFNILRHDPSQPDHPLRDRLVLSVGHTAPALYATLAEAGYFNKEELLSLRKLGSRLQGHPGREHGLPGLELSAGSLGQGLPVAVGMALSDQLDKNSRKVFCITGDGEMQEGSIWEALMSASHHQLKNICLIIDRNGLQIDGNTSDVMDIEPLKDKLDSFGWKTYQCDGNDILQLLNVFDLAIEAQQPAAIIAKTKMGKGVKSIEGDYRWHGKAPSDEQLHEFLTELEETD